MPSTSLAVDRYVVTAAIVLTCVLFTAQAADPVNVIKLTALVLCALSLIATSLYRSIRHRIVHTPTGPVLWISLLLGGALVVSATVAPVDGRAIYGTYGRNSGLLAYLSALLLFLAAARTMKPPHTRVLILAIMSAGLFTACYGLLQRTGVDPINWANPFNPIIAALGNPNFAAAYLGIAASVAAGAGLWRGWSSRWRIVAGVTSGLCLLATSLSDSAQGPIAAAGGVSVVAAARLLELPPTRQRVGLAGLFVAAASGVAVLLVGALAKAGPAAGIFSDTGSKARVYYWDAAVRMFQDKPVTGVGLDQYGTFWRTHRSVASVEHLGGPSFSDAAHSVPLQVLAQGGLILGLTYMGFLALIAVVLVRGLIKLDGPPRMLLASLGGGWTAYQVQSAVSIDQVPLIVLHFTLAGGVLAAAGAVKWREWRLPGAVALAPATARRARSRSRAVKPIRLRRKATFIDALLISFAAVLVLFGAWQTLKPLRADVALASAGHDVSRGDGNAALKNYRKATDLLPQQPVYWDKLGSFFVQVRQPSPAASAYDEAIQRDRRDLNALRNAARLAEERGDLDEAREHLGKLLHADPVNPESIEAASTFELRHGGAARARQLLEAATRILPEEAALWAALGDARAVLDDQEGASVAYRRALELDPESAAALEGLKKLQSRAG